MPHVQECRVLDFLRQSSPKHLFINVEVKIQMSGLGLHAPHHTINIKGWAATLPLQPRCTELKGNAVWLGLATIRVTIPSRGNKGEFALPIAVH